MPKLDTILLAEDDPKDVELTMEALEENNLANEVIRTKDGVETLDYLLYRGEFKDRKPGNPAVLLLDLKMPRMNGLEVLQVIRETADLKHLPVVMLTSSREEQDLVKSYQLGVNAYVVKPVDFNQFVTAVSQIGYFWAVLNQYPEK